MAVRPIPKKLLPHTITVEVHESEGRYGETWAPPVVVKRVRVDPSNYITKNSSGSDTLAQSTLFIDAKNSEPAIVLTVDSKITFDNEVMHVNKVEPLYADSPNVHHWECELI